VDPPEGGEASLRPLLERLHEAPQKVVKFLSEAPVACVSHALAFLKLFYQRRNWRYLLRAWLQIAPRTSSTNTSKKPVLQQNRYSKV
jgi:hypothetical protein